MKTTKNKRAVTVGIFIALGLLILVVGVFTLGGQQKKFVKSIDVNAAFEDVGGLQQGNNVWFSGVKIGTVKKITIAGNHRVNVILHIEKKAQEFIRRDAKAKLGTDGLIGNKIILIYGGTPTAPAIEAGDNLLVERTLSTDDMMATLQENNKNLIDITTDFKKVSAKLANGEGTLGALLTDQTLFKSLEATVANLQVAAKNSQRLTGGIAEYTAKLQSPNTLAGGLVTDTVIMSNLKEAVAQLNQASTKANELTESLKTTSARLNNEDNTLGMLLNDKGVAEEFKSVIQNLNSSSVKLDENLEALQHNFLFRGYFRKKAKEDAKILKETNAAIRN